MECKEPLKLMEDTTDDSPGIPRVGSSHETN